MEDGMPKALIHQVSSTNPRDPRYCALLKLSVAVLLFLSVPRLLIGQGRNDRDVFDKMFVGAFDPDAWNGIVFDGAAYGQRLPFAIRLGSKNGRFLDGERIFDAVSTVGPYTGWFLRSLELAALSTNGPDHVGVVTRRQNHGRRKD